VFDFHPYFRHFWLFHFVQISTCNALWQRKVHYQCLMCPRRFRNNHNKKQYPGRGSMVCHLATEHGQLLKQMRADTKMDMQSEIEMLDKHEGGKFLEAGIPDVPDNELYVAKEHYMWKFEQSEKAKNGENKDGSQTQAKPAENTCPTPTHYSRGRQVYETHTCTLSEIPTEEPIGGQDACRPGRPAKLPMDQIKLHYVVHYRLRGFWEKLVPKEKPEELGKIEVYQCLMCQRRFRNNHNKKQYPGRGSMVCHLATEHGQLLKAMRADPLADMQSEIEALDKHESGKFLEVEIPDVPDDKLYVAKESYMWKFEQEDKLKALEKEKKI
jgi:DNA-directed RNA polymerase subunit RPC12/RpoP